MFRVYPSRIKVLMLNPRVGLTWEISPPASFFRIVVLPALSRPLQVNQPTHSRRHVIRDDPGSQTDRKSTRISFDLALFFRMIVSKPGMSGNIFPASGSGADCRVHRLTHCDLVLLHLCSVEKEQRTR